MDIIESIKNQKSCRFYMYCRIFCKILPPRCRCIGFQPNIFTKVQALAGALLLRVLSLDSAKAATSASRSNLARIPYFNEGGTNIEIYLFTGYPEKILQNTI
jgi:hypothetical protein